MKIRNKKTGQVFEVIAGSLYAKNIFEEVTDDEIKVGEPKVEYEVEIINPEPAEAEIVEKPKKLSKKAKKTTKKSSKKGKKDDESK